MQEKNPNLGDDPKKKEGEWPETGKQGGQGQGDVGKKGGDYGQKPREGEEVKR
ncbi:MAG TPA: hypothetical protein VGR85_00915 [Candidatus Limnocylindria bacterium]|jgi:hypothetical protein|nr:hypothetical protein [Candidatus Limnocylindria bacterium]